MRVEEYLEAYGNRGMRASHPVSFEFTKDDYLTSRGDCIIGVRASKSAADLPGDFRTLAQRDAAVIRVVVEVDGLAETATGKGSKGLTLTHPHDMVFRKSMFTCARTVMVSSDMAASDFSRRMIQMLRDPRQKMSITLTVERS